MESSDRSRADEENGQENDEQAHIDGLIARGEAVPEGTDPLPPGATHVVVQEPDGRRRVRRCRFSAS